MAEYKHLSLEALHSRLRRVAHDLQKYSHVNKKAMEQFKNFTQQRESLLERKGELDNGYEAIDELIKVRRFVHACCLCAASRSHPGLRSRWT